ncbi:GumC family protein [Desulfoluna spongiiphila]|uniref:Polysaccharide chain length determinant protein, PEP-CTERM locus subfamily n=1 Tax=Desulfoluna spongiiphila TaxID=419481 RepID=A0A1G5C288_9BACT|nr:GNVR domain-containing protein [Desulfoluna spongiiphila]SCX96420.1 polysaccharide chain length determinant protein, PEP-CTERM locus subfamily [Desulfoluna spongiiphila]
MKGIQRDKNDMEFYIGMVAKWYWIVLITLALSLIFGIYRVLTLQNFYEARTVILVQPQNLPPDVVRTIVAEDTNIRITTLSQRIQSRTNLEKIIEEFDLFSGEGSQEMFMEDKVAVMRKRISVDLTRGRNRNADSFTVSYRGTDPVRVTQITEALAANIIDENLKLRESLVLGTNSFLEAELKAMRVKLVKTETGLKEYRERYMGGLPEQLESNLSILDSLNERLTHVRNEVRMSKERLDLFLQRSNRPVDTTVDDVPGRSLSKEQELERLREELNFRLKRYTEFHPDVLQVKSAIRQLESEPDEVVAERPRSRPLSAFEQQRADLLAEIRMNEKERDALVAQIRVYKKRVEDTPKREQELISLQRDYDNIRSAYHSLLNRQIESQIAVNMEKQQKGGQFRIIDPARVPEKPMVPDMQKVVLFILVAGLGLGCGIVAMLELMMPTFRGAGSVEVYTAVPVIANIPTIEYGSGIKRFFLTRVLPVAGCLTTVCLLGTLLGLVYIKG